MLTCSLLLYISEVNIAKEQIMRVIPKKVFFVLIIIAELNKYSMGSIYRFQDLFYNFYQFRVTIWSIMHQNYIFVFQILLDPFNNLIRWFIQIIFTIKAPKHMFIPSLIKPFLVVRKQAAVG